MFASASFFHQYVPVYNSGQALRTPFSISWMSSIAIDMAWGIKSKHLV